VYHSLQWALPIVFSSTGGKPSRLWVERHWLRTGEFVILLRVPGTLEYRELATRVVTTACKLIRESEQGKTSGLSEEFTYEAVSAVGEAFNNVALHGYENLPTGDIIFEVSMFEDRLVIDVKDFGHAFHPDNAPEPDLGELPESGMGLFIIRAFVDELTYEPGSPNCLRMVKRFGVRKNETRKVE
jgi:serine/threonine-protein kinase RsbW